MSSYAQWPVRRQGRLPRVVLISVALFAGTACTAGSPESVAVSAEFRDALYHGIAVDQVHVREDDVSLIGKADRVVGPVSGRAVYELDGVDPREAMAMQADFKGTFMIFFSERTEPFRGGQLGQISGICTYLTGPELNGC